MGFSRKSPGLCKNPDGIPGKEGKNAGKFGEVVRVSMEFQRSTVSEIEYPQQVSEVLLWKIKSLLIIHVCWFE